MRFVLFALALPLLAQSAFTLSVDAGSPTERNFTGGAAYGAAQQADMARQAAPFNSLRYGPSFQYAIPAPNGVCSVTLSLLENRPAGPNPATQSGPGTRLFTVTANGVSTAVDIFALSGAQTPLVLSLPPLTVTDGLIRLAFVATRGNASISGISADCAPTPALPFIWDPIAKAWRFDGDIHVSGFLETGTPGTPTKFTITRRDGSVCEITYEVGQVMRCP